MGLSDVTTVLTALQMHGGGQITVARKRGEKLRERVRDDGGIWWPHLCGGCRGMETLHQETPRGKAVKWAVAYATSLLLGCREEWSLKMIINHYIELRGGCIRGNTEFRPVSLRLSSNVNSLSVILQDK